MSSNNPEVISIVDNPSYGGADEENHSLNFSVKFTKPIVDPDDEIATDNLVSLLSDVTCTVSSIHQWLQNSCINIILFTIDKNSRSTC